jgi:hypothetical protein
MVQTRRPKVEGRKKSEIRNPKSEANSKWEGRNARSAEEMDDFSDEEIGN